MPSPDELMKLVAGGPGKTGAPAAASPAPAPAGAPSGAPVGSPMTTPQPNQGEQQAAMIDISMAMDLLEKALGPFGSESLQGQAIYKAIGALQKEFGEKREKAKPLMGAEIQQLVGTLGKQSPEMMALMGGGGGPPGGAPGGAPPQPMAA